jgi:hypothetical protein
MTEMTTPQFKGGTFTVSGSIRRLGSRGSVFGIVYSLQARQPSACTVVGARYFFLLQKVQTGFQAHSTSCSMGNGLFSWSKAAGV